MPLIDLVNEPGDLDALRKELREAGQAQDNPESKLAPEKSTESIPEKYREKRIEDIIEMHRNAESALGRTNNELGQYKKLTDELLSLKRQDDLLKSGANEADIEDALPELSSTDLLDNPTAAVAKVLDARLTANERKAERKRLADAAAAAEKQFADAHPDAAEITATPEFRDWVSASALRLRAAREAYEGDYEAGAELLTEFKSSNSPTKVNDEPEKKEVSNIEKARKAATVSAGASQSNDAPKGKIYRRLDLIRLKIEDPEAYGDPSFQQEIMRAYNEGRVK